MADEEISAVLVEPDICFYAGTTCCKGREERIRSLVVVVRVARNRYDRSRKILFPTLESIHYVAVGIDRVVGDEVVCAVTVL